MDSLQVPSLSPLFFFFKLFFFININKLNKCIVERDQEIPGHLERPQVHASELIDLFFFFDKNQNEWTGFNDSTVMWKHFCFCVEMLGFLIIRVLVRHAQTRLTLKTTFASSTHNLSVKCELCSYSPK